MWKKIKATGKSLSDVLIFASTNPQYEEVLYIELLVQCVKIPSSEHVSEIDFDIKNYLC